MTVMNLDQLEVWRLAQGFAITVYKKIVPSLPASEKYNLADQLKRAAVSIHEPQAPYLLEDITEND